MKLIPLVLPLLATLSICSANEKDGWEALREHCNIGKPDLKVPPVISDFEFDAESFTVTIKNESKEPVSYEGYFSDEPQYFTGEFVDGSWVARPNLWCGTGMKWHELKPHDEAALSFPADLRKRQIFIIIYGSEGSSSLVKVWDPDIEREPDAAR